MAHNSEVETQWGEYEMPHPRRSPEQLVELRAENRRQNDRLKKIESDVDETKRHLAAIAESQAELRVYLIGIDGKNGMRSVVNGLHVSMDRLPRQIALIIAGMIGAAGTLVGIVATLVSSG